MWAEHKSNWKWDAVLYYDERGDLKGSLAVLIRKIPLLPCTIMYGCRGPVCDPGDLAALRELVAGAKKLAEKYRSYEIKLDPDVMSDNAAYGEELISLGFLPPSENKNFESIQPLCIPA
jgi:lipid II:glycine glycyltransferase (peptidoglycan interpeptide bridge formation enzyme)